MYNYYLSKNYLFAFFILVLSFSCKEDNAPTIQVAEINIIPMPVKIEIQEKYFLLGNKINFRINTNNEEVSKYSANFINFLSELNIKNDKKTDRVIQVNLDSLFDSNLGKEGYKLEVNPDKIVIQANEPAGIFNAYQTLKQLIPHQIKNRKPIAIPGCIITDYPRFKWRGLMLDVSRHFFTVDEVKMYIDKMSEYKFNVFHWHLTDDHGWRIEIKSLPKLTEIGAWRVERYGRFGSQRRNPKKGEKTSYGGFYTQDQIREIIRYAAERNITIVPEIDMPGHSMAALAAYPELSTKKEPKFVNPGSRFSNWFGNGKFEMLIENTLNPADEEVYKFVDKVFTEVAALFPGAYIHMGGDEAYHGYWERDKKVRNFMKKNGIKSGEELQSYFVKRVEKIISSKGKKMIGWDEILQGGLAEGAAVMSWRGMKGGIEAAKMQHEVVMSPTTFAYLDYTQGDYSVENKIYASLSLEKAYEFEPIPEGVDAKYILGGQANLWTEAIPNLQYAFYMTYPRAFATAESLWSTKESKNWNDFIGRTEKHFDRFDVDNKNISRAVLDPIVTVYYEGEKLMCKLENNIPNTEIRYTIDNTYPANFGKKYNQPFELPLGNLDLYAQTFRDGTAIGRELHISRKNLVKRVK